MKITKNISIPLDVHGIDMTKNSVCNQGHWIQDQTMIHSHNSNGEPIQKIKTYLYYLETLCTEVCFKKQI